MSYTFKVIHDGDGIRLDTVPDGALKHIPSGTFSIGGHHVSAGTSEIETISVQLTGDDGSYGWAQASVKVPGVTA